MSGQFQLTSGIISRLLNSNSSEETDEIYASGPTLQFLSVKVANSAAKAQTDDGKKNDRFRIILSDGNHFTQSMLATQLNNLVYEEKIGRNTVAVIENWTLNTVQNKRLIIILGMKILGHTQEKIGNPISFEIPAAAAPGAAPAAPPVAAPVVQQRTMAAVPPRPPVNQGPPGRAVYPIEGLSPYNNKWTIKARVTQKTDIRTWSNQRGEGKLFSCTFMDETGEIRGTAFNEAVDLLYEQLQEGRVYYVSKGRVTIAKRKFSNVQNEYELQLERGTEVEECLDQLNLPKVKYDFISLGKLVELAKDATCDVIGVVTEVAPLTEIISKTTNKAIPKRELTIVDRSQFSVRLTLWGRQAEQYSAEDQPVIAFKGVRVGDFGGRSLSMINSSIMDVNPDIPEGHGLRGWYDATGSTEPFQSHTSTMPSGGGGMPFNRNEIKTLLEVKEAQLGQSDQVETFSTRATIVHVKADNATYPACPRDGCNKKVVDGPEGWRCEKCDSTSPRPEYRYIISMSVADYTDQAWLQGFNDVGVQVLGMTANELHELRDRDESAYNQVFHKANCKTYNFVCRAKQDTFNERTRVRYAISKIDPLDYKQEANALRDLLFSDWAR